MTVRRVDETISKKLSFFSFVAAVMVVLIHTPTCAASGMSLYIEVMLSDRICQVAVPFFFAASGYLMVGHVNELGWWKAVSAKRVRTVLVPYLFWCAVFALVYWFDAACRKHPFGISQVVHGFGVIPKDAPFSPLWYLRQLLLLLLPLPLFVRILTRGGGGGLFLFALFVGLQITLAWVDMRPEHEMLLLYFFSFRAMFYFCVGIWLRFKPIRVNGLMAWGLLAAGLALFVLERRLGFGIMPLRHFVSSVAVALTLAGLWCVLPPCTLPKFVMGMSFPIYLIHRIFILLLELGFDCFGIGLRGGFVAYALVALGAVAFSLCVGHVLINGLPRIAAVAFGGRGK